jgi:hypothetical protein
MIEVAWRAIGTRLRLAAGVPTEDVWALRECDDAAA